MKKIMVTLIAFSVTSVSYANLFTINLTNKSDRTLTFSADSTSNPLCPPQGNTFTISPGATVPISFMCENQVGTDPYRTMATGTGVLTLDIDDKIIFNFYAAFTLPMSTGIHMQTIDIINNSSWTVMPMNDNSATFEEGAQIIKDVSIGGS